VDITAGAHAAGLYTNLITSAVGITDKTLGALAEAGLDHVQISIQDSGAQSADHIAGYEGAFAKKRALAAEVVRRKLPLTVNAVVHRANIDRIVDMVDLARALGASRIEIAHVQYYGWALKNRAALMPSREQVERAATTVAELRARHHGRIVIDAVVPDYYARYPKPCVGGWGRRSLNVTPAGKVLPCHAAQSITGLEFWNVRERSLANILGEFPGLQRLPRHRMDEGAVRKLPASRAGFRRLPLPSLRAHRRRHRNRSGMPPRSRPRRSRPACGHPDRRRLCVPAHAIVWYTLLMFLRFPKDVLSHT
jgi:coenzyme PQQ biosynthesis enzyme PqqE